MDFRFSKEEEEFRKELGEFLDKELTEEIARQNWEDKGLGPEGREFARKLGAKGWLGLGWPEEYGGSGGSPMYEFILVTELARRGAHVPNDIARLMGGPTILRHGSDELKKEFLPRIARGEIEFALGYTEPQAGSDLAALEMRAVEDGDCYIMNGQKMFNTECHYADYHWLAARTDPDAPRHRGISLFVVDMNSPGITIRPLWTMSGERTNEVFYDNVRVPKKRMVGEINKGFYYIITALNHERLTVYTIERLYPILNGLIQYAQETQYNGKPLAKDPMIRRKLAQMAIEFEVGRMIEYQAYSMICEGRELGYQSGVAKVFSSEMQQRLTNVGMQVLGQYGQLQEGSKWAPLKGKIEREYRASYLTTLGAGSSEIIRNIIAQRGLDLPRG